MRIAHVHNYHTSDSDPKKIVKSSTIEVDIKPISYLEDLGVFDDEKEFFRFIVRTKYYIRKSGSYTEFIKFLKKKRGMNRCGVHPNIRGDNGFSINIHHTPLVLEDIVHIVIAKRQKMNESLTMSAIAKEVMELHYMGLVGFYPLCETCHEYAHSDANDLFIPLNKIYGDPESFVDIYQKYLEDSPLMNKFQNILVLNKGYNLLEQVVPMSLRKKYIYVRMKSPKKNDDAHYIVSNKKLYDLLNSDQLNALLDSCIE